MPAYEPGGAVSRGTTSQNTFRLVSSYHWKLLWRISALYTALLSALLHRPLTVRRSTTCALLMYRSDIHHPNNFASRSAVALLMSHHSVSSELGQLCTLGRCFYTGQQRAHMTAVHELGRGENGVRKDGRRVVYLGRVPLRLEELQRGTDVLLRGLSFRHPRPAAPSPVSVL
eukprot:1194909-Prorocentrum_minimum.AAC.5